ncbi:hypothetical protein FBQ82_02300 [Anaerolineae bacterium CFX7]|nr:hypothetical protein [Anaerolineae bacterium CFX7]
MYSVVLCVTMRTMNVFFSSLRGALPSNAPRSFCGIEAKWLRAARRGDMRAFNQLVARHQARAYRVAFHLVQDAAAAANITQTAIAHAPNALGEVETETFQVWLLRQITQRCAAFLQLCPPIAAPRTQIQRGMELLPFPERVTVVLADLENLTTAEIARITRVDATAARQRLHRARCALRDSLLNEAA